MSIELPKDAEGREIPLDTEVLYTCDGSKYKVAKWEFYPNKDTSWLVCLDANTEVFRVPGYMYLTPPDSWEKLLEDLGRCAGAQSYESCAYFGKGECGCTSCFANNYEICEQGVMRDIASRIRKLRGDAE